MGRYTLRFNCTDFTPADAPDLLAMQDAARRVCWPTFARRTRWQPLARSLGYAVGREKGLRLKDDPYVGFYRSRFRGQPCYYLEHSRVEHIFLCEEGADIPPPPRRGGDGASTKGDL